MLAHHEAAQLAGRQVQARALVDTGVQAVRVFLAQPAPTRQEAGGIFNNEERFRGVLVIDDPEPENRGSFTVIAANLDSDGNLGGVRFGLEDESSRLNLNTLLACEAQAEGTGRQLLMALPGMTEDVADAILDWLDGDDEPREFGAEIDFYSGLSPAYAPKNGPLETVEELLLVRGVTPALLFGADVNRNGQLDTNETTEEGSGGSTDPASFRGWSAYLTLYSLEWNVNPDGKPRIFLNNMDLNKLHTELSAVFPPEWVNFIIAYRQSGPANVSNAGQSGATGTLDLTKQARTPIGAVLDLVGAKVNYTFQGATQSTLLNSPWENNLGSMNVSLPRLMDHVTVNPAMTIPGRINVNQAPAAILAGIPGMDADIVSQILTRRDVDISEKPNRRHESWLLQEGIVTLQEMKIMLPFITGGGSVYRAQVVGYFQGGQAASRAEVVFDATRTMPRLLFWRDISQLGRGYALETLGVNFTE
ncbi:MAG: type II secretion system protein GspK [Pirellulaceae bacterium]|nr:type II secretion system protein GspK [Pirellulaceae bacterium]